MSEVYERFARTAMHAMLQNNDLLVEARERAKRTGQSAEEVVAEFAFAMADAMTKPLGCRDNAPHFKPISRGES